MEATTPTAISCTATCYYAEAGGLVEPGFAAWLVYNDTCTHEWLPPTCAASVMLRLCQLRDEGHPALAEDAPPVDVDADGTLFLINVRGDWIALDGRLRVAVEEAAYGSVGGVRGAQWRPYARAFGDTQPLPPPPPHFDRMFCMPPAAPEAEAVAVEAL